MESPGSNFFDNRKRTQAVQRSFAVCRSVIVSALSRNNLGTEIHAEFHLLLLAVVTTSEPQLFKAGNRRLFHGGSQAVVCIDLPKAYARSKLYRAAYKCSCRKPLDFLHPA